MTQRKKYTHYIFWLILITAFLRIIIARYTGLGIGESYYFGGVTHPSLSYFDQPPLFFWLSTISTKILGMGPLGLRLPSILFFALSTWLLYSIARKFYSDKAAFYSGAILNLSFVFTIPTAVWFQPDASLIFFWLATIYGLVTILFPSGNAIQKTIILWFFVGITLGMATLCKYHSVFLILGSFLFILINKNQRHWLKHPGPYLAISISLLFAIPVFIWNNENNWVSFVFQGSRAGTDSFSFHFDWFLRSIVGQSLWIAPWIWVPAIQQLYFVFQNSNKNQVNSFVFWMAFPPIAFFTTITLWTNTAFHFHWQAPGYIVLFIALGNFILNKENNNPNYHTFWKSWWVFSTIFLIGFSTIALIYTETGFFKQFGPRWFTGKFVQLYDPTIEGYDFDDIAKRFHKEGWIKDDRIFIITDKWWNAGKIDWPLRGKKPVLVFSNDPRNYAYFDNPNNLMGFDAIIFTQKAEKWFMTKITPFFESIEKLPDLVIYRSQIPEENYKIFIGRGFKKPEKTMINFPVYRQLHGLPPY